MSTLSRRLPLATLAAAAATCSCPASPSLHGCIQTRPGVVPNNGAQSAKAYNAALQVLDIFSQHLTDGLPDEKLDYSLRDSDLAYECIGKLCRSHASCQNCDMSLSDIEVGRVFLQSGDAEEQKMLAQFIANELIILTNESLIYWREAVGVDVYENLVYSLKQWCQEHQLLAQYLMKGTEPTQSVQQFQKALIILQNIISRAKVRDKVPPSHDRWRKTVALLQALIYLMNATNGVANIRTAFKAPNCALIDRYAGGVARTGSCSPLAGKAQGAARDAAFSSTLPRARHRNTTKNNSSASGRVNGSNVKSLIQKFNAESSGDPSNRRKVSQKATDRSASCRLTKQEQPAVLRSKPASLAKSTLVGSGAGSPHHVGADPVSKEVMHQQNRSLRCRGKPCETLTRSPSRQSINDGPRPLRSMNPLSTEKKSDGKTSAVGFVRRSSSCRYTNVGPAAVENAKPQSMERNCSKKVPGLHQSNFSHTRSLKSERPPLPSTPKLRSNYPRNELRAGKTLPRASYAAENGDDVQNAKSLCNPKVIERGSVQAGTLPQRLQNTNSGGVKKNRSLARSTAANDGIPNERRATMHAEPAFLSGSQPPPSGNVHPTVQLATTVGATESRGGFQVGDGSKGQAVSCIPRLRPPYPIEAKSPASAANSSYRSTDQCALSKKSRLSLSSAEARGEVPGKQDSLSIGKDTDYRTAVLASSLKPRSSVAEASGNGSPAKRTGWKPVAVALTNQEPLLTESRRRLTDTQKQDLTAQETDSRFLPTQRLIRSPSMTGTTQGCGEHSTDRAAGTPSSLFDKVLERRLKSERPLTSDEIISSIVVCYNTLAKGPGAEPAELMTLNPKDRRKVFLLLMREVTAASKATHSFYSQVASMLPPFSYELEVLQDCSNMEASVVRAMQLCNPGTDLIEEHRKRTEEQKEFQTLGLYRKVQCFMDKLGSRRQAPCYYALRQLRNAVQYFIEKY